MTHHHLTMEPHPTEGGNVSVKGQCTCGGWLDFRLSADARFLGSAVFNGYPHCPAVGLCARQFDYEIAAIEWNRKCDALWEKYYGEAP